MNENYQNPNPYMEQEEPIDWAKYISAAIKYWKKIAVVTLCFAVLSVIVALCQKRVYNVSVTVAPEAQGSSRSASGLGGLASMLGVNLNTGGGGQDALNITLFPEIASSTPFLTQLFEVELTQMPKLPKDPIEAREVMSSALPKVKLYDYITKRNEEKGFFAKMMESIFGPSVEDPDYLVVNASVLTKEQNLVLMSLRNMIAVDVDKKTAMTTLTVKMDDPLMCSQLADTICQRLTNYVFVYRTQKEQQNFDYYSALCDSTYKTMVEAQAAYAESLDNNQSVTWRKGSMRSQRLQQEASIAEQVYQQMVTQRESSRAQLQQMKPVFAIIEPATMPQRPANSRKKTCIIITFFGFALACGWYVVGKGWVDENLANFKTLLKENA